MSESRYDANAPGSLIALAAWLFREATMARRSADSATDPISQRVSLEAAARFDHASQIVKEVADQARRQRAAERRWPRSVA